MVQRAAEHTANVKLMAGMRGMTSGNRWSLLACPSWIHQPCSRVCTSSFKEALCT